MAEQHETEVGRGGRGRGRRISLTTQRIADATCPAEKGELMLWDAEVSGLAVRLLPTGRKTFVIYYRAEGGGRTAPQRKMSLGEVGRISLRDARRAALAHLGSVAKGGDPAAELRERRRRERSRLAAALERYAFDLERRQVVKRREVESLLRRELLKKLGDIDLAELGRAEVVQRIEEIEAEGRPGTSRDFRAKVTAFLGWAESAGLMERNPLTGWRRTRRTKAQRLLRPGRALQDSELPAVWQAFDAADDPVFAAYLRTLLLTGQRRTETAAMRWSDLDAEFTTWTIPAEVTKSGRAHRVPLPPELASILRALPRFAGSELVFPGRRTRPISGFTQRLEPVQRAAANAGLARWTLHDLRRTVRTGLGRLGVEPPIAELLLNHAIGDELAATYDRGDYWQRRAEVAARWARHVAALVGGEPDGTVVELPRRASG